MNQILRNRIRPRLVNVITCALCSPTHPPQPGGRHVRADAPTHPDLLTHPPPHRTARTVRKGPPLYPSVPTPVLGLWRITCARAPYRLRAARERCGARLRGSCASARLFRARRGCARRGAGQAYTPASGWLCARALAARALLRRACALVVRWSGLGRGVRGARCALERLCDVGATLSDLPCLPYPPGALRVGPGGPRGS